MKIQKKIQKGIMLIEVIAVLGLVAAITPMLFQQISRRNDDILNIQIATEMRSAKEALAAFIKANERTIAENCGVVYMEGDTIPAGYTVGSYMPTSAEIRANGGYVCYLSDERFPDREHSASTLLEEIKPYYAGEASILNEYEFIVSAYTVPSHKEGDLTFYRPVVYGTVHQLPDTDNKAPQKLKDATKIASLIGLDGGVVVKGSDGKTVAHGMQSSWILGVEVTDGETTDLTPNKTGGVVPVNTVVATTLFDEQKNSAILKDVKLEHFKGISMVTDQAQADRMLIREVFSVGDENCIENQNSPTMRVGTVAEALTSAGNCLPFFEVSDNGVSIRDGRIGTSLYYQAYIPNPEGGADIVPGTGATAGLFSLDLSGTSMMDDIRLASLGNANLSEVIPKWSLMAVAPGICSEHGKCSCSSTKLENFGAPCTGGTGSTCEQKSTTDCKCSKTECFDVADDVYQPGHCKANYDPNVSNSFFPCKENNECPCDPGTSGESCTRTCVKHNYCINFGDWSCPAYYRHAFVAIPAGRIDRANPYVPEVQRDTMVGGTYGLNGMYYDGSYGYVGSNVSTSNPHDEVVTAHTHSIQVHTHRVSVPVARSSIEAATESDDPYDIKRYKEEGIERRKYAMTCYNLGEYYLIHSYCVNPLALLPKGGVRWRTRGCANGQYFNPFNAQCTDCTGGQIAPLGANSAAYCMNKCQNQTSTSNNNKYPDISTLSCKDCPEDSELEKDENGYYKTAYSINDCKCKDGKMMYKGQCIGGN